MSRNYIAIAFLAAALILGAVLVWPKYQNLSAIQGEVEIKELELQSKTDYFAHIRAVSEELGGYQESLSKIYSALPDDPSLPSTFNYLQGAASQAGLILEEVAVGTIGSFAAQQGGAAAAVMEQQIRTINLNLSLSGSYQSLKDFLAEIEGSARIIEIKKVTFISPEEEDEAFSFDVDVVTYNY